MTKIERIKRSLPAPYDTRDVSGIGKPCNLGKLCTVIGTSDQDVVDQITAARDELCLGTAHGQYLSIFGSNVGVPRPPPAPYDDDIYRKIVSLLGYTRRCVRFTVYKLMEIVFGTRQSIISAGGRAWNIYVVNPCEIIIELPGDLFGSSNENASYVHGIDGDCFTDPTLLKPYAYVYSNIPGNYVGFNPYGVVFNYYSGGVWSTKSVKNWTWNGSFTEIELDTNIPNGLNVPYYMLLDSANTHTGDYIMSDASVKADTATTPSHTDLVYLSGAGKLEIVQYYIDLGLVTAAGIVVRYVFL